MKLTQLDRKFVTLSGELGEKIFEEIDHNKQLQDKKDAKQSDDSDDDDDDFEKKRLKEEKKEIEENKKTEDY